MQTKPLFAALVAAAFAVPLAASAGMDKPAGAKPTSAQTASTNGANDGGAESMFKAMDKNGDGVITKEESLGTPHHAEFAKLDTNGDGKLTREEHAAAPEHAKAAAGSSSSPAPASTSGAKTY